MSAQKPGDLVTGLREDVDYAIRWDASQGDRLYVDDAEVLPEHSGAYLWRPEFYAGRVQLQIDRSRSVRETYWLDVGPSPSKAGHTAFAEMVDQIRSFDPVLLGGQSGATMLFGQSGQDGRLRDDILLTRVLLHGPAFLKRVKDILQAPHRSLALESQVLPLSQVRRLPLAALRDRRLALIASGGGGEDDVSQTHMRALQASSTVDTPANRTLAALLRRFRASLMHLHSCVSRGGLGTEQAEQERRRERRLSMLREIGDQLGHLLNAPLFSELQHVGVSAAGLTQIAAHPRYSIAYSTGCRALNTGVDGDDLNDLLHVAHSWGIYETWCYLMLVQTLALEEGASIRTPGPGDQLPIASELVHICEFPGGGGRVVSLFFQGLFPSVDNKARRAGFSLSRERRPDIVAVARHGNEAPIWMVFDAKWRSGRERVLDAMESAHIYHDALRLAGERPRVALLLLPGDVAVPLLETRDFQDANSVGTVSRYIPGDSGPSAAIGAVKRAALPAGER